MDTDINGKELLRLEGTFSALCHHGGHVK